MVPLDAVINQARHHGNCMEQVEFIVNLTIFRIIMDQTFDIFGCLHAWNEVSAATYSLHSIDSPWLLVKIQCCFDRTSDWSPMDSTPNYSILQLSMPQTEPRPRFDEAPSSLSIDIGEKLTRLFASLDHVGTGWRRRNVPKLNPANTADDEK